MGELTKVLADCELSDWAGWLITSTDSGARETRVFLERAFVHLPTSVRQREGRRSGNADSSNTDAFLHELLAYEVCYEFGLDPVFGPSIAGKTPDFTLKIAGQTYIADVFLTHRPKKTVIEFGDRSGYSGYRDCGEAAKKIADRVSEKAATYRELHHPLILFVVFAGHNVRSRDLETALYGATVNELSSTDGLNTDSHEDWHRHGAFCPPGQAACHREISAVIGCDWFDTLARSKPGRRLHCVVYHHWQPRVALALRSFGRFQDVYWVSDESTCFTPKTTGEPNLVMSTTSGNELQWGLFRRPPLVASSSGSEPPHKRSDTSQGWEAKQVAMASAEIVQE
jgi:hypothetical protein